MSRSIQGVGQMATAARQLKPTMTEVEDMGISFSPLLWFVCRTCRQVFPDTDRLSVHKKLKHSEEYMKVKCIIFEERLLDNQWIPSDNTYAKPDPGHKTEHEILPEKLYCHCNCTSTVTLSPEEHPSNVKNIQSSSLKPESNNKNQPEAKTSTKSKEKLNPYVALKRLTAHDLNVALKARSELPVDSESEQNADGVKSRRRLRPVTENSSANGHPPSKKSRLEGQGGDDKNESGDEPGSEKVPDIIVGEDAGTKPGEEFILTDFTRDKEGQIQFRVRISNDIFETEQEQEQEQAIQNPPPLPVPKASKPRNPRNKRANNSNKSTGKNPIVIDLEDDDEQINHRDKQPLVSQIMQLLPARSRQTPINNNVANSNGNSTINNTINNQTVLPASALPTKKDALSQLLEWLKQKQFSSGNHFEFSNTLLLQPDLSNVPASFFKKMSDKNPVECKLCRTNLISSEQLNNHAANCWVHNKDRHVFCVVCSKQFTTPVRLKQHLLLSKHYDENPGPVDFNDPENIDNDVESNFDDLLPLPLWIPKYQAKYPDVIRLFPDPCSVYFESRKKKYPIECQLCSEKLASEICVKIHVQTCWVYNKRKHRYCATCNKAFANTTALLIHIFHEHYDRRKSLPSFLCITCDKEFRFKEDLMEHRRSVEDFCKNMYETVRTEFLVRLSVSRANRGSGFSFGSNATLIPVQASPFVPSMTANASSNSASASSQNLPRISFSVQQYENNSNHNEL